MPDQESYLSLASSYYRGQPNFMAMLQAITKPLVAGQAVALALPQAFDLDVAIGAQLDVIGQIVNRSRVIETPLPNVYFSFDVDGLGFDQGVWATEFDTVDGLTLLDDFHYRILLRAVIAANYWDGTLGGSQVLLAYLFNPYSMNSFADPGTRAFITDNQELGCGAVLAGVLPGPVERALFARGYLNFGAAGMSMTYSFTSVNGTPAFGFDAENDYVSGFDVGAWTVFDPALIQGV